MAKVCNAIALVWPRVCANSPRLRSPAEKALRAKNLFSPSANSRSSNPTAMPMGAPCFVVSENSPSEKAFVSREGLVWKFLYQRFSNYTPK